MNVPDKLLEQWWKVVFLLGTALVGAGFAFPNLATVNPRHLVGLGLGLILMGLSFWIANKHVHVPYNGGLLSTEEPHHNTVTKIIFFVGLLITVVFLFCVLYCLVDFPLCD